MEINIDNIRSSARHIQQKFVTYLLMWSTAPQISYLYAYVSFVHYFTNTLLRVFKKESVDVTREFGEKAISNVVRPCQYRGFTIILRRMDAWSARRRDLYLTAHNTHNRQTSMFLAGFEPSIPVSERP